VVFFEEIYGGFGLRFWSVLFLRFQLQFLLVTKVLFLARFYDSRVYLNSFCPGKLDSRTRTSLSKIKIK